jgi:hypothetical protein
VAAEDEGEASKQVEQESDHRAEIVAGWRLRINRLPYGRRFGEGHPLGQHLPWADVARALLVGHAPSFPSPSSWRRSQAAITPPLARHVSHRTGGHGASASSDCPSTASFRAAAVLPLCELN